MIGSSITGWGLAVPDKELGNEELARRFGKTPEWITKRTGIRSRRLATGDESAASLGCEASKKALSVAGLEADELDMVIVATSTPDYQMPSAASLVQHRLGAVRAGAFDLNAACSGFLYGLAQAHGLVAASTARRVLVCGSDTLTHVTDDADIGTSILFGDGAGSVIVEATGEKVRLGPFKLLSDGAHAPLLYIPREQGVMRMKGREVYRHAVEGMTNAVTDILDAAGLETTEVDALVAHQANARILEAVGRRLDLKDDQVLSNIGHYGNTSAASIPIELAIAADRGILQSGSVVVVTAFGAGFAWGAGIVRWGRDDDLG